MRTFHFTDQDSDFTCLWEWSPHHSPDSQYRILDLVIQEGNNKEQDGRVSSANSGEAVEDDDDLSQASHDFPKILKSVLHAFIFNPYHFISEDNGAGFKRFVDEDLANRLCLPLTMPSRLVNNRLAVVGQEWGDLELMHSILDSAHKLGVRVTIMGWQDECLDPVAKHEALEGYIQYPWRDAWQEIRDLLFSHGPFHGVISFNEYWMIDTAIVARELGLPTLSPNLVERLLDRRILRLFCPGPSDPVKLPRKDYSEGGEESETALRKLLEAPGFLPEYPLIAKARMAAAHGTEGSYLATNIDELVLSIKALSVRVWSCEEELLIDQYEEGPEVDANFVLQGGKLLAFELTDRFPTTADQYILKNEKTKLLGMPRGDFLETNLRWPSKLPQREKDLVHDTVCGVLRSLKSTDGVFHAKVRIRNSSVHYAPVPREGGSGESDGGSKHELVDLVPRPTVPEQEPSVLLLGIKPRPPGHGGVYGEKMAHGVDYQSLHLLCALGEQERFRALARPFGFAGGMPPLWVNCVFINVEAGQVYVGGGGNVVMDMIRDVSPVLNNAVYCSWLYGSRNRLFWEPWNRPRRLQVLHEIRARLLSQDHDSDPAALDQQITALFKDAYHTMAYTFAVSPPDDYLRRRVLEEGRVSANYVSWGVEMIAWSAAFAEESDGVTETRLRRLGFRTRFKCPVPDQAPWDEAFPAAARARLTEEVARAQAGTYESAEGMETADFTPVALPNELPAGAVQTTRTAQATTSMPAVQPPPTPRATGPAPASLPSKKRKLFDEKTVQTFATPKAAGFGDANAMQHLTKKELEAEVQAKANIEAEADGRESVLAVSANLGNLITLCRMHGKSWREIGTWTSSIDSLLDEERAKLLNAHKRESKASEL
ncbi:hypothetical protein PG993_005507 [Apiospora rasikravindrae]|uniref:BL00235/CARNS1 N-terminal domain-containing protein n=1 Tax=Apiospora rasikravindrae TaxID=990691 RepID=A0ABR1TIH8_9PEZI